MVLKVNLKFQQKALTRVHDTVVFEIRTSLVWLWRLFISCSQLHNSSIVQQVAVNAWTESHTVLPRNEMQSPKHEISFPAIFLPMLCCFTLFPSIPYTSSLMPNLQLIATIFWYLYWTMQWLWLHENAFLLAFIPCTQRSVLIKMVDVCFSASLSLSLIAASKYQ